MNGLECATPRFLWLLSAVPALAALCVYGAVRRARDLRRFSGAAAPGRLSPERSPWRRNLKDGLAVGAVALAMIAGARPVRPARDVVLRKGHDTLVLLDISKSMLAADVSPNRLEAARRAAAALADRVRGERIGLMAFAGGAEMRCPLTSDYDFFRLALAEASPDTAGRRGTQLAGAIRAALERGFDDLPRESRRLVILTDGEDHGEPPDTAAREAEKAGVQLIVLAIGTEAGAAVPDTFYDGRVVWSRPDRGMLRRIAHVSAGGAYLEIGEDPGSALARRGSAPPLVLRQELYQWPLAAAVVLLLAALFTPEARRP